MKLGRYAYEASNGQYYDSLRHIRIAKEQLEKYKLLEGQEEAALIDYLTTEDSTIQKGVSLVPSYECNLRCKMCCVGHMLKLPTGDLLGTTDLDKLIGFMRQLGTNRCGIVGGEPLLHYEIMTELKQRMPDIWINITTNGVWDYEVVKDALAACSVITFSIDGLPDEHNKTRIALKTVRDTYGEDQQFAVTMNNLVNVCHDFPDKIISVQGSMTNFDFNAEYFQTFKAVMMMAGVKSEHIKLSHAASSQIWSSNGLNKGPIANCTRVKPCCDFSLNNNYVVYNNQIYSSYYNLGENKPIGELGIDSLTLLANHRTYILKSMPILNDDVCIKQCKAVGICWGMCTNITHDYKKDGLKISDVCGRETKEKILAGMINELSKNA